MKYRSKHLRRWAIATGIYLVIYVTVFVIVNDHRWALWIAGLNIAWWVGEAVGYRWGMKDHERIVEFVQADVQDRRAKAPLN